MPGRDKACLERESHDLGFIRDTFEKTCRIAEFLGFLAGDEMLRCCLALKGGTAVNLAVLNLPRLSVDADFDLTADVGRDELPTLRTEISAKIKNHMDASGYRLSDEKSKYSHALDSYEYEYTNAGAAEETVNPITEKKARLGTYAAPGPFPYAVRIECADGDTPSHAPWRASYATGAGHSSGSAGYEDPSFGERGRS